MLVAVGTGGKFGVDAPLAAEHYCLVDHEWCVQSLVGDDLLDVVLSARGACEQGVQYRQVEAGQVQPGELVVDEHATPLGDQQVRWNRVTVGDACGFLAFVESERVRVQGRTVLAVLCRSHLLGQVR